MKEKFTMKEKVYQMILRSKRLIHHFGRSVKISWRASPGLFFARICYEIISVALPIVSLFLSKSVINILSSAAYETQKYNFYKFIAMIVILQLGNALLGRLNTYLSALHNNKIGNQIDLEIMKQINLLDISYFDNPAFYDQMQNAIRDSKVLQSLSWNSLILIKSITQLCSHLIILVNLNPLLPIVIVICTLPSVFGDKYVAKRKFDWQLKRARNDRKLGYVKSILQSREMAKDIRVFGVQEYFKTRYLDLWEEWLSESKKMEKLKLMLTFFASILPVFATTSVLILVGNEIFNGVLTVGDYSLYGGAASQLLSALTSFTGVINNSYESEMRLSKYEEFLKLEPLVKNTGELLVESIETIEFKNVCFSYPNTARTILNNLSFSITKNQSLALVGLNGAGKSTIVKLILRLYDPDSGEILINGIDLKEYDLNSYYKCIGVVFQDFCHYTLKLRETIALPDINGMNDDQRIRKACESSDLNINIDDLRDGIDTYLGKVFDPEGLELSGGNWQKIAIAQAFFKSNSSLMIFDEPNAALDPDAEQNLFRKMVELSKNKCVIYVTHRLSAATTATRILVIHNGSCCESGSHYELIQRKGLYYDLFTKQAEHYREKT